MSRWVLDGRCVLWEFLCPRAGFCAMAQREGPICVCALARIFLYYYDGLHGTKEGVRCELCMLVRTKAREKKGGAFF
jgi:hypothetical protein